MSMSLLIHTIYVFAEMGQSVDNPTWEKLHVTFWGTVFDLPAMDPYEAQYVDIFNRFNADKT